MNRTPSFNEDILGSLVKNTQNDAKKLFNQGVVLPITKYKIVYKSNKKRLLTILNPVISTNGNEPLKEEKPLFNKSPKTILVPWQGVDKSKLEIGDNVMIDIDPESTYLPVFCKILIIHQGAVRVNSPPILARDVCIQVGAQCEWLRSSKNFFFKDNNRKDFFSLRERKLSWTTNEEYYSIPHHKYKGKTNDTDNKDIQVLDNMFFMSNSSIELTNLIDKHKLPVVKSVSTVDFLKYFRWNNFTKSELLSSTTLEFIRKPSTEFIIENKMTCKKYRRIFNNKKFNSDNLQAKRFEDLCPITGTRRLRLIMPFVNASSNLAETKSNVVNFNFVEDDEQVEKYEEYEVTDSSVDTSDLEKYIKLSNYTHLQLLSDACNMDKEKCVKRSFSSEPESSKSSKYTENLKYFNSTVSPTPILSLLPLKIPMQAKANAPPPLLLLPIPHNQLPPATLPLSNLPKLYNSITTVTTSTTTTTTEPENLKRVPSTNDVISPRPTSKSPRPIIKSRELSTSTENLKKRISFQLPDSTDEDESEKERTKPSPSISKVASPRSLSSDFIRNDHKTISTQTDTEASNKPVYSSHVSRYSTTESSKLPPKPNQVKKEEPPVKTDRTKAEYVTKVEKLKLDDDSKYKDSYDISDILARYNIKEPDFKSTPRQIKSRTNNSLKNLIDSIDNKLEKITKGALNPATLLLDDFESNISEIVDDKPKNKADITLNLDDLDAYNIEISPPVTPIASSRDPCVNGHRNYCNCINCDDYYTNHARYPLISRAVTKPVCSIETACCNPANKSSRRRTASGYIAPNINNNCNGNSARTHSANRNEYSNRHRCNSSMSNYDDNDDDSDEQLAPTADDKATSCSHCSRRKVNKKEEIAELNNGVRLTPSNPYYSRFDELMKNACDSINNPNTPIICTNEKVCDSIEKSCLSPSSSSGRHHHYYYYHEHSPPTQIKSQFENLDDLLANQSRYRRSKYDKSLSMYVGKIDPNNSFDTDENSLIQNLLNKINNKNKEGGEEANKETNQAELDEELDNESSII